MSTDRICVPIPLMIYLLYFSPTGRRGHDAGEDVLEFLLQFWGREFTVPEVHAAVVERRTNSIRSFVRKLAYYNVLVNTGGWPRRWKWNPPERWRLITAYGRALDGIIRA